jgi:hypothetical protein
LIARIIQKTSFLAPMVSGAASKHSFLNYPAPILHVIAHLGLRRLPPEDLRDRFTQDLNVALILLDDLSEQDWMNTAKILGRSRSVEQIFQEYLEFFSQTMAEIQQIRSPDGKINPEGIRFGTGGRTQHGRYAKQKESHSGYCELARSLFGGY